MAFYQCAKLNTLTIGSEIDYIGSMAFANCPELTDVYCHAKNVPKTDINSYPDLFRGSYIEYATLYVPTISVDAYQAVEPWKSFKTILGLEETTPEESALSSLTFDTPAMITACGGIVTVSTETDGLPVSVYTIDGQLTGSATVSNGQVTISTTLRDGNIGIVKIGDKAVKVLFR